MARSAPKDGGFEATGGPRRAMYRTGTGAIRLGPRAVNVVTFLLEECQQWECERPSYKE